MSKSESGKVGRQRRREEAFLVGGWYDHKHGGLKWLDVNWELFAVQGFCDIEHESEDGGKIKTMAEVLGHARRALSLAFRI